MLAKTASQSTPLYRVHIHSCGNGRLGFRSDSGSLCKSGKVSKTLLPHHSAPRLGSVCPNAGLNPWAAATRHPWRGAANPASCRVTHEFKPAFGQRGLTGRLRSRSKADQEQDQEQSLASGIKKATGPWGCSRLFSFGAGAYCTSTARLSLIFFCQMAGPVMWTDSPLLSTATVTGMSLTSNS